MHKMSSLTNTCLEIISFKRWGQKK